MSVVGWLCGIGVYIPLNLHLKMKQAITRIHKPYRDPIAGTGPFQEPKHDWLQRSSHHFVMCDPNGDLKLSNNQST